ncbi:MAG: YqgE/AlgH family protein [Bradymonadales bacterium]|nr:YqgE/AlgH family protein [Bradymonadales bacterium]
MDTRLTTNLAPGFLVAMPQLTDPNFSRMVVLMLEHNEEGSLGIVINNPLPVAITFQVGGQEVEIAQNIYLGGPVSPNVAMIIHGAGFQCEGTQEIIEGLCLSEPSKAVPALTKQSEVPYRFLLGYAGWGPGQLAGEMAEGAWLFSPASAQLALEVDPNEQWNTVIRSLGIDPMMLVPSSMKQ